ncbi:MAG: TolC family protein [Candidatus Thioglobus sp.]|nr:TolC family protein [Candidatus Thioglobus pontius]MBL6985144.1 TolC family protein [Candidatus Thioglobus sp.]
MNKTLSLSIALLFSVNAVAMTQSEFVDRLKNTHPFFTQLDYDQQTVELDYVATTANQDWTLTGLLDSTNTANNQTSSGSVGLTHNLTNTGADIVVSNSWSDGSATDKITLNYTQPLLKNSKGVNDQLAGDLSTIRIDINKLKRYQGAEKFILSQLFKLVDLSFAQQQLTLSARRLELASQELALVKDKFSQSVVDQIDVFLQEDAYQRALQKQLQAEQTLDLLKEELSVTLNMRSNSIISDYDLYKMHAFDLGNLRHYLNGVTEMKTLKLERDLLQRQLLSDKSNAQAQLDLKLGVSNENDNDWNVGLGLSYPIGDTKAKALLNKTQVSLSKTKEAAEEQLIELTVEAGVLKKKLTHLQKLLNTYQARIEIANSRALAEKERYNLGNSQMSFVISAQNNVHEVNLAYAQAAVSYQKSVLEFKAVIDQLL